ncbi:hypothetical protein ES677_05065 [Bizionia gelidisalsuginis]|uniref:Uncharacterized protein n=1 Tax=Bizionia gelidisalsuginis TaxID=291188 RepID=A0ABY3MBS6_9FLAO|nr:hypothetical protein [Bizionia gelidisalsuginis]TYC14751.1 hypothetical protein ES677_05065 [Bizionia gelidisalsuginis]
MNSDDTKKFGLIIIESLPNGDKKTGFNLHHSTIKYKVFQEPNLSSEFYDVDTGKDLVELLKRIVNDAIANNYFFFFHFEIHGFDGGLELKNGDEIYWNELLSILLPLNIHYKNTLGLYLAVCNGASLLKYLNPMERSPFRFILASPKNIKIVDLEKGFDIFYEHFFFSYDIVESLEKYNSVIINEDSRLSLITSQYCIDTLCDIERETADKDKILDLLKEIFIKENKEFENLSERKMYEILKNEMTRIFDEAKLNKDYYLMKDLE